MFPEGNGRNRARMNGYHAMIPAPEGSSKEYRKSWAGLIQKIYGIDPLTCPKCQSQMRIIAFIEDEEVIKRILTHLGLWEAKAPPPPKVKAPLPTIYLFQSD